MAVPLNVTTHPHHNLYCFIKNKTKNEGILGYIKTNLTQVWSPVVVSGVNVLRTRFN